MPPRRAVPTATRPSHAVQARRRRDGVKSGGGSSESKSMAVAAPLSLTTTATTLLPFAGHTPSQCALPFLPMLLTQYGNLADTVEKSLPSHRRHQGNLCSQKKIANVSNGGEVGALNSPSSSSLPPQFQPPYFISPKHDGIRCISWKREAALAPSTLTADDDDSASRLTADDREAALAPSTPRLTADDDDNNASSLTAGDDDNNDNNASSRNSANTVVAAGGCWAAARDSPTGIADSSSSISGSSPSPSLFSMFPTTCFTRFGSPLPSFAPIEEELALLRVLSGDEGLCLDGELFLHDSQVMTTTTRRGHEEEDHNDGGTAKKAKSKRLPSSFSSSSSPHATHLQQQQQHHPQQHHGAGYRRLKEVLGKLQHGQFDCEVIKGLYDEAPATTTMLKPMGGGGGKRGRANQGQVVASSSSLPLSSSSSLLSLPPFPAHPRLCVFDVISYTPPPVPTSPLMAHVLVSIGMKGGGGGLGLQSLRCEPNHTSFMARARTLVFLFTLLHAYTLLVRGSGVGSPSSLSSSSHKAVMAYPAPVIADLLQKHSFYNSSNNHPLSVGNGGGHHAGGGGGSVSGEGAAPSSSLSSSASSSSSSLAASPLFYRGGHFVKLVPYALLPTADSLLTDAPNVFLPRYLSHRYEGAVVRTAMNVYGIQQRPQGQAPLLSSSTLSSSSASSLTPLPSVRSLTAAKLLPYFDKEYLVLRYWCEREEGVMGEKEKEKGKKNAKHRGSRVPSSSSYLLSKLLCCTNDGTPFFVSATNLSIEERRSLGAAMLMGDTAEQECDGAEENGSKGEIDGSAAAAVGSYVTLQFASVAAPSNGDKSRGNRRERDVVPLNAVIKGLRGKEKRTFM